MTLPVPPLLNRLYRISGRRMFKDGRANDYKLECVLEGRKNNIKCIDDGNIELFIIWFRARKAGDIDGILKVVLDSLQGVVYKNDSQITRLVVEKHDDKKNPRIELEWYDLKKH